MKMIFAVLFLLVASLRAPAEDPERAIHGSVTIDGAAADVWKAWTTEDGIRSFFAPDCRVDLRVGGAYEMYFDLDAEPGSRGGEGNTILAIDPETMLSFTWNAPPSIPTIRNQRTHVTIRLHPVNETSTQVQLTHDGWGDGEEWDRAFEYFERAWLEIVLPRLQQRFSDKPID